MTPTEKLITTNVRTHRHFMMLRDHLRRHFGHRREGVEDSVIIAAVEQATMELIEAGWRVDPAASATEQLETAIHDLRVREEKSRIVTGAGIPLDMWGEEFPGCMHVMVGDGRTCGMTKSQHNRIFDHDFKPRTPNA